MKCLPYLIAILICLGILILLYIVSVICKHWQLIKSKWEEHNAKKFIISVVLPFLIPFIITIGLAIFNASDDDGTFWNYFLEGEFWFLLLMCVISVVVLVLQYKEWKKEHEERKTEWVNSIYFHAYNNLKRVLSAKTSAYRTRAVNSGHGFLEQEDIGYDVFAHIRNICDAFSLAISDMTDIADTHVSVSFIYRYTYNGANQRDSEWRWILGKDSNLNISLDDFVNRDDTMYHYIINNSDDFVFYNDKQQANREGRYYFSSKDKLHNSVGSIIAAKIFFSSNAETCCEGVIMLTTYGKTFIEEHSERTPQEFEELLKHEIFSNYKQLLKTELGMLYFRHKTEKIPNRLIKAFKVITSGKDK